VNISNKASTVSDQSSSLDERAAECEGETGKSSSSSTEEGYEDEEERRQEEKNEEDSSDECSDFKFWNRRYLLQINFSAVRRDDGGNPP
jgi:hypothetical protein